MATIAPSVLHEQYRSPVPQQNVEAYDTSKRQGERQHHDDRSDVEHALRTRIQRLARTIGNMRDIKRLDIDAAKPCLNEQGPWDDFHMPHMTAGQKLQPFFRQMLLRVN